MGGSHILPLQMSSSGCTTCELDAHVGCTSAMGCYVVTQLNFCLCHIVSAGGVSYAGIRALQLCQGLFEPSQGSARVYSMTAAALLQYLNGAVHQVVWAVVSQTMHDVAAG